MATFKQNVFRLLKDHNKLNFITERVPKKFYILNYNSLDCILQRGGIEDSCVDMSLYRKILNKYLFKGKQTVDIKITTHSQEEKDFIDFCIKNDIRWASSHAYDELVAWRGCVDNAIEILVTFHTDMHTTWGNNPHTSPNALSVTQFTKQYENLINALNEEADNIFLIHGNTTTKCVETVKR
jgi:hypothetical protein